MIKRIQAFFSRYIESSESADGGRSARALHMAAGTLLFEVARSDHNTDPREKSLVERQLRAVFGLGADEVQELALVAEQSAEEATSLFPFTRLINQRFDLPEKIRLVEMLWQVAYADGNLDPYEEGLVRKIAELLYVPHREFIRAKHRVNRGELSLKGNKQQSSD